MGLTWYGDEIAPEARIEAALTLALEHVLGESNAKVPHEYGDLERSGEVSTAGRKGRVTYDSVYAAVQHEDLTFRHSPGREAKFLENAANNTREAVAEIIARALGEP